MGPRWNQRSRNCANAYCSSAVDVEPSAVNTVRQLVTRGSGQCADEGKRLTNGSLRRVLHCLQLVQSLLKLRNRLRANAILSLSGLVRRAQSTMGADENGSPGESVVPIDRRCR